MKVAYEAALHDAGVRDVAFHNLALASDPQGEGNYSSLTFN